MRKKKNALPMCFVCAGCGDIVKLSKVWEADVMMLLSDQNNEEYHLEVNHSKCNVITKLTSADMRWGDGASFTTKW
jgi:glycerol dehydrogenase-like iron-containing ADH family enzyme